MDEEDQVWPKLHAVFIVFALSSTFSCCLLARFHAFFAASFSFGRNPRNIPKNISQTHTHTLSTRLSIPTLSPTVAEVAATADLCYVQAQVCESVSGVAGHEALRIAQRPNLF